MTLQAELETHLQRELGDAATAQTLAAILLEETLSWRAPAIAPERIATVFAFTFGNRMLPNGNREPGPVNQALADVVATLHQRTRARVFAQWEVAAALAGRVPDALVTAINPGRDARGEPVYLSTSGVLEEMARRGRTAVARLCRRGGVCRSSVSLRRDRTPARLRCPRAGLGLPCRTFTIPSQDRRGAAIASPTCCTTS